MFPTGFLQVKRLKDFVLHADENMLYFDEDSGNATFCCNEMGFLSVGINNLNDTNYEEDDPDSIIQFRILAWYIEFEKRKELKKELSEEFMPIAWSQDGCWDWCMLEYEKNKTDPMFIEEL